MTRTRTPEHQGPAWLVQAAVIARRFYLDGRSKVEIGEELGLSRFKVARILDEARALGLVEVTVRLPAHIEPDLSTGVRQRFGLRRAIVVDCQPDEAGTPRADLGRVAAGLLSEVVTDADVLGLTCSRTVAATTGALDSLAGCRVVQLTGTLAGPDMDAGSVESVRRAADVGGGRAYPIYAPMVLPDAATARVLAGQSAIEQTMAQFDAVTVAVVAIGAWDAERSTVWQTVDRADRDAATEAGAVGEIGARIFDTHGAALPTPVDDRVLGVTLAQLRRIPEVVGLAYDGSRGRAVRAALAGGVVDTLVCDVPLARALLAPDEGAVHRRHARVSPAGRHTHPGEGG